MPVNVTLTLGNPVPVDARTSIATVVDLWRGVHSFFDTPEPLSFVFPGNSPLPTTFAIDASDTIALLELVLHDEDDNGSSSRLKGRMQAKQAAGLPMLSSTVTVSLTVDRELDPEISIVVVHRFLDSLFIAMNLCAAGGCNMGYVAAEGIPTRLWHRIGDRFGDLIETAWVRANEAQWPSLSVLPFPDIWGWLDALNFHSVSLAKRPIHKALITLLNVASSRERDAARILQVVQTLEALLTEESGPVGVALLGARLEAILGPSARKAKWFKKLYALRSGIAHGAEPWLRPDPTTVEWDSSVEAYGKKHWKTVDEALGVLLAVLQKLALAGAAGVRFREQCEYVVA